VVAVLLGRLVLDEELTARVAIGALVIVGAVAAVVRGAPVHADRPAGSTPDGRSSDVEGRRARRPGA
jgi:hypothetical protein